MAELMIALAKFRDCVGSRIDFSMLMMTPRDERKLSNMEVDAWASCLDRAIGSQSNV